MGLKYYSPELKEGQFRISPSSLSVFFDNSAKWYKQSILKQDTFKGNTASVCGSLMHNRIERHYEGKGIDKQEERKYLDTLMDNTDVDEWIIKDNLEPMWLEWLKSKWAKVKPIEIEPYYQYEPREDIVIGGSIDMLYKDEDGNVVILDWKTKKTKPSSITQYRLQLLTYAWICKQLDIKVDKIKVVYIQWRTKTIEPRLFEFDIDITSKELDYIESQLKIVVKSLTMAREDKDLIPILFRNNPSSYFQ